MEELNKDISFFKKIKYCICDFEKYPEMAIISMKKVITYILTIMLIFTLVITILSICNISKEIKKGVEYFKNELPDVTISNNNLIVDSDKMISIDKVINTIDKIIIDTNEINEETINLYKAEINKNDTGIILLKNKLIYSIEKSNDKFFEINYSDIANTYGIKDMTKQDIISCFEGTNYYKIIIPLFITNYISLLITYLISTIIDALALAILGYVTTVIMRVRIKFSAIIKIAIYSLTLPIIMNLGYIILQHFTGFEIKYFEVIYIAVSYIYIITSILMIKSDLIKRGQELMQIIEEQKDIHIQENELDDEDKNNKDNEKNDKDTEKDNNKNNEKNDIGKEQKSDKEPQGDNA